MLQDRENKILGQEFLTWLWYKIETSGGNFTSTQQQDFGLAMMENISVEGKAGDVLATATVKNPSGELTEAKSGLLVGKKVNRAQLKFNIAEEEWIATLRAENFTLSGLKTPKIDMKNDEGDDPDTKFLEKMYLLEKFFEMLDSVFQQYLSLRMSSTWQQEASKISHWIAKQ